MAEKKCPECPKCLPRWLAQFEDLMSLLLVFFVLILSMSVIDQKKIIEYLAQMKYSLGVMESTDYSSVKRTKEVITSTPMEESAQDFQHSMEMITESIDELNRRNKNNIQTIEDENLTDKKAVLKIGKEKVEIMLPNHYLFDKKKYKFNNQAAKLFMNSLMMQVKEFDLKKVNIEIISKTKDELGGVRYIHPKTDHELSAFRLESIKNELEKEKIIKKNKVNIVSIIQEPVSKEDMGIKIRIHTKDTKEDLMETSIINSL